jgi:mannosylglycerate synthase
VSLVVFPFKEERADVVIRNIRTAAMHPRIRHVLAVAERREATFNAVSTAIPEIERASGTAVGLVVQDRLGVQRSGKGDGMNTGLRFFVSKTALPRMHFYDADITNFTDEWITRAEAAADRGFDVVRHNYPRARCDAMITWMITRVGFALLWPESDLVKINQPLGGELLFSRDAAELMLGEPQVTAQSDWGIDTIYTFTSARLGLGVYELYMQAGKQHALYQSLGDLRTMLIECFATVQALQLLDVRTGGSHVAEGPQPVPLSLSEQIGFDIESTLHLLMQNWTPEQERLLRVHFPRVWRQMVLNRTRPSFSFMDETIWYQVYRSLLVSFIRGDAEWEELLFKLWTARVLSYTTRVAARGHDFSREYLERTIKAYIASPGAPPHLSPALFPGCAD